MDLVYDRIRNDSAINYFLCPFLSLCIDRRWYAIPLRRRETTLGGTAYVSNKIFNASNFLMVVSQAKHPLLC